MQHNENDLTQSLARIEVRLISLERWLRFANMDRLREILSRELNEERKKLAYEYSDGSRGYRDVGQIARTPATTVKSWWGRWFSLGIMEISPNRAGRVQKICSLREIGFDIPSQRQDKSYMTQIKDNVENPPSIGDE